MSSFGYKTATILELVSLKSKDWVEKKSKKIKVKIISRSKKE